MAEIGQLEELIASTVTIPTIPRTLLGVNRVVNDPDGSAADAAKIVAEDPAIASKVLRQANSSLYALRHPVSDIQHAVCILGLRALKTVVVETTVMEHFRRQGANSSPIDPTWLWDHSLRAARAARLLTHTSRHTGELDPEEAYTSGLLHDIGKVLLLTDRPAQYTAAVQLSRGSDLPLFVAEQHVFGFSHTAVGALLADRWNLSPGLCTAIAQHHTASPADADVASALLQLADAVAHRVPGGDAGYHTSQPVDEDLLVAVGISESELESVIARLGGMAAGEL